MAFVLDVNLRIKEILGLQKIEAALSKLKVGVQTGAGGAGGAGAVASLKSQTSAANTHTLAINGVTSAITKLSVAQKKSVATTAKASASMKKASVQASGFGQSVKLAGVRYAAFLAATAIPFAVLAGLGKATASVIEFDTAILKLRQISGQSQDQISGLRDKILDLSVSTGTSASELARISKIMSQAGFRGEKLTEALTALSKVPLTPSFQNIDSAVEGTIAALNQFNKEGLKTEDILDTLSALEREFAASAEDLALGLTKGGSAFQAIGGKFREFAALMTVVRDVTRESASTVGTFFKTLSSRLADPKIIAFLEGKGIRIGEAIQAGNPILAIKQIASALRDIGSVTERNEIGTKLAGRRQISRFVALVSNIDKLDKALNIAGASAGVFGKIAAEGLEGLEAQLNILGQEFNKLIQTLAEPLFVPIIKGVTSAGKALVSFIDFIKPVIPALTAVVGLAAGFKLLALSITASGKALAFLSSVGVGGGLPGILRSVSGAADGGAAGQITRERIQSRLAGGVGGAAAAGGAASRNLGVLKRGAVSPLGQLASVAALILVADKMSDSFEEAGSSSGVLAAEFVKAAGILVVGASLVSGKTVADSFKSFIGFMTPWGAAISGAIVALGIFTLAATKSVDIDIKSIIDAAAKKVSEIKVSGGDLDTVEKLQKVTGDIGSSAIDAIQESANRFETGLSGVMAGIVARLGNLFAGEGLISIGDSEVKKIIATVIGDNPERLNEIFRSAVEQFGIVGLEGGLDKLISESLGGNVEAASRVRVAMIKEAGGIEKIANSLSKFKLTIEVNKMAVAIEKVARDFSTLVIPAKLTIELGLLSEAVRKAATEIDTNAKLFGDLSQNVGRDVGITPLSGQFSTQAVKDLASSGNLGEIIDFDKFPELGQLTENINIIGSSLEDFAESILASKVSSDSLSAALSDPQVDPFDIINEITEQFLKAAPTKLPPEAVAAFKIAAQKLALDIGDTLASQGGVILDGTQVKKALEAVLSGQLGFSDAIISAITDGLNSEVVAINAALAGDQLLANLDIKNSNIGENLITSLQDSLAKSNINVDLALFDQGFQSVDGAIVQLAQDGDLLEEVLSKLGAATLKNAQLSRQVADEQAGIIPIVKGVVEAFGESARELLQLQVSLTKLTTVTERAPAAFANEIEGAKSFGLTDERAAEQIKIFATNNALAVEEMVRLRENIEAEIAIDVSQIFEQPAVIFAKALTESASAIKIFTRSLTLSDLEQGAGALNIKSTPGGRNFTERNPVPEAKQQTPDQVFDKINLQAAVFGTSLANVTEIIRQQGAILASDIGKLALGTLQFEKSRDAFELANELENFTGFIPDIFKLIQDSNVVRPEALAGRVAQEVKDQSTRPDASGRQPDSISFIGASRSLESLATNIELLIKNPDIGNTPEVLQSTLSPTMLDFINQLSPSPTLNQGSTIESQSPSTSAAGIQQAAAEIRLAADATERSTEAIGAASTDIRQGGVDILSASQGMGESIGQLKTVADVARETAIDPQEAVGEGVGAEASREAALQTTEAVNALGDRLDAVVAAVDLQTVQAADIAAAESEKPLIVDGLEENTVALGVNEEAISKSRESMSELGTGIDKVAVAMEEGIGIDLETMSSIKVDVSSVTEASSEFTKDFEAVATKVVKAEIRIVLQQLAAASGNSELASTFESVVT